MKAKIGQIITFKSDRNISLKDGTTITIKSGDKAQVLKKIDDTTGQILYLTGEASGKTQYLYMEIDGVIDADDIAKRIMQEINRE